MKQIICINGDPGSGKSTVARALATELGYDVHSSGQTQRAAASTLGLSTLQLNQLTERDPSTDRRIDSIFSRLRDDRKNYVIDSRMAWHFIPDALKIRLVCHPLTSGRRVLADRQRTAERFRTLDAAIPGIQLRRASERRRFSRRYHVDVEDLEHYDVVVQTDDLSVAEIVQLLVARQGNRGASAGTLVLSPGLVFPTDPVRIAPASHSSISSKPIEVLYVNDCFFVKDGHDRLAQAVKEGRRWLEGNLHPDNRQTGLHDDSASSYIARHVALSTIYDWERAVGVKYPFYPEAATKRCPR